MRIICLFLFRVFRSDYCKIFRDMLRLLLPIVKDAGMKELHLSVERDNEASIKTIMRNGGKYERSFEFEGEQADIYKISL